MKKKLEAELISIAHTILKLKGKEDVNKMHSAVSALYEKLTVLKFANENFESALPTIGNDSSFFGMLDTVFNNKTSDTVEVDNKTYVNMDENNESPITEPVTEKIKDIVAQMPAEAEHIDAFVEEITSAPKFDKNDFEQITADFKTLPEFDPINVNSIPEKEEKKSLNDALKQKQFAIGLNDKLAFITQLFDGSAQDYERVISQLNTATSFDNAKYFIASMIKPDYNNWEGKEEVETRFMALIEARFN